MKQNLQLYSLLICSLFVVVGCSPVPISKVYLADDDIGYWNQGTAIGEKSEGDIVVEAVFSHSDKHYDYYDVAFENLGENRVLVSPKSIKRLDLGNGGNYKAIDPELMIINQELKASRKEANAKTIALVAGAAVVAGTVAAIATSDGDSGSSTNDDNDYLFDNYTYIDVSTNHLTPMSYQYFAQEPLLSSDPSTFPSSKDSFFWEEYTLRKTTLFKGQRVRGLIAFIRNKNIRQSRLVVPVDNTNLEFEFIHKEFRP